MNITVKRKKFCEGCDNYISDKTKHFQSESQIVGSQQSSEIPSCPNMIVNKKSYIKY